jgi:triphosphoribosyl-dephospho-CoA synthase
MNTKRRSQAIAREIGNCAGLAVLLEVAGSPKPGNVHRYADFSDTRFEHFLTAGIIIAREMEDAASRGIKIGSKDIAVEDARIGEIIKNTVTQVKEWQRGGNTSLGTIILLTPLSVASGITHAQKRFSILRIRENLREVLNKNTPKDTVDLYEAISIANPGGLGKVSKLDISDTASTEKIITDGVTLREVFKISADRDSISKEWTNTFTISFETGFPEFESIYKKTEDVNCSTIHTFLKILSEFPDTLIARKRGEEEAVRISARAREVLEKGGCLTEEGNAELRKFDSELRDPENQLNPGTSADLTAASIMIALLNGFRP